MKTKIAFALAILFLMSSCSGASGPIKLTERQEMSGISFQSIEGYTVAEDGEGGVYFTGPDQEIGILFFYKPSSEYTEDMTPVSLGGQYPQESFPVQTLVMLAYPDIELKALKVYKEGDYSGYRRQFTAVSEKGDDEIHGEYVFFTVGDFDFVAMGTVVHTVGLKDWDPQGQQAFDAILSTLQFNN